MCYPNLFKAFLLVFQLCLSSQIINGQQLPLGNIIGLWSLPFKTSNCKGMILMDIDNNHNIKILQSIDANNAKNVAFRYLSGTWIIINRLNLQLDLTSGTDTFRWTSENEKLIREDANINKAETEAILNDISQGAPTMPDLGMSQYMSIRDISETRLILYTEGMEEPIVFYRMKKYPKGDLMSFNKISNVASTDDETQQNTTINNVNNANGNRYLQNQTRNSSVEHKPTDKTKTSNEDSAENNTIYTIAMVEQQPEFPGGTQALYKWLNEHMNYPAEAAEEGIQGRVIVEFVVNKTGRVENVRVLRGRHPALDKEAIRVAMSMPNWKPARNDGKAVKCTYTLPVTFKLPQ